MNFLHTIFYIALIYWVLTTGRVAYRMWSNWDLIKEVAAEHLQVYGFKDEMNLIVLSCAVIIIILIAPFTWWRMNI